jgi:phospholipid/cholesterol/gamma-HCH transport system substrate-binding protein
MSRQRRWSALLPGVIALVLLIASMAAVVVFARVGNVRGRKMRLYATVPEARGLSSGSEVWLAGARVGTVDDIAFLPASSDTTRRLLLTLQVLDRVHPVIRSGAAIDIRPGGNLIGAPVVEIGLGTPHDPPIEAGDTLHAIAETDLDRTRVDFESATAEFPLVIANLRVLATQLRAAHGTLGAIGIDHRRANGGVRAALGRTIRTARRSTVSVGFSAIDGDTRRYASELLARVDSIRHVVGSSTDTRSLGRFRGDTTLLMKIASLRRGLDEVAASLASSRGAAGRLQHDEALSQEIAHARAELSAIMTDLKRNPLRYLAF